MLLLSMCLSVDLLDLTLCMLCILSNGGMMLLLVKYIPGCFAHKIFNLIYLLVAFV